MLDKIFKPGLPAAVWSELALERVCEKLGLLLQAAEYLSTVSLHCRVGARRRFPISALGICYALRSLSICITASSDLRLRNVRISLLNLTLPYRPDHKSAARASVMIPLAGEGADFIGYALVVGREARFNVGYGLYGQDDGFIEQGNCLVDKLGNVQRNVLREPATQDWAKAIPLDYSLLISGRGPLDSYMHTDWAVVGGQFGHGGDVDRVTDTLDRGYV